MYSDDHLNHIEKDLYGKTPEQLEAMRQLAQQAQDYNGMVHAALSGDRGADLRAQFEIELKKPVFVPGATTETMMLQEGARQYIMKLLKAYENGGAVDK